MVPSKDDLKATAQGGVSLWYIATRCGVSDRSDNWILNYVRCLVANERFPTPLPSYDLGGRKREGITFHSRWLRFAVDAWFNGTLPPHLVSFNDNAIEARDAARLDQRADELAGAARLG